MSQRGAITMAGEPRAGSPGTAGHPSAQGPTGLRAALRRVQAGADRLDREPAFPTDAFRALAGTGVLGVTLPGPDGGRIRFSDELRLISQVSRADGSVGRILDGHLNAIERLRVASPASLDPDDRAAIAAGELLIGVWGADPGPGEGVPARLRREGRGATLDGVKTFCSGAGGVHRALVVARDEAGERRLVYLDLDRGVSIDRSWYRGSGLRASESHRVVFDRAPVRAIIGGPGEMVREPWFSRDAIRTSATWSGIAAGVVAAALSLLGARDGPREAVALAAGRMRVALGTIERWIAYAADSAEHAEHAEPADGAEPGEHETSLAGTAIEARWAIAAAAREIAADAALACGSHPLATGGALSRGRRDLDLFLLQHRLEPLLARHGASAIAGASEGEQPEG